MVTGIGAICLGNNYCRFRAWAPYADRLAVQIVTPQERRAPMRPTGEGWYEVTLGDVPPGTRYYYEINGSRRFPDPASFSQPEGVHGPSEVVDPAFDWEDADWKGLPQEAMVLYELHVGTYTQEGTFAAITPHLSELRELGITAIELLPVAEFPGNRNWGYDGVYPFAVEHSYGGPKGLKQLVNECHKHRLAVILDVVYNHLGPEGNYLAEFGPYYCERYQTPWGRAINFDGSDSEPVRQYFIENALRWITEFHIDGLRLDAVHAIFDQSAKHILEEIAEKVQQRAAALGRMAYVIAESDLNDPRLIRPREAGGYGLDAQWNDDFHHALHVQLTGEKSGYYVDFQSLSHLEKAFREGFVYSGEHSEYRRRSHGSSSADIPAYRLIVCSQNHDQVGNRLFGERISTLVSFEAMKLGASVVLLSPFLPLLWMGEEYGETAPFQYFVSHTDEELVEAVRRGRLEEFRAFGFHDQAPDPQSEETFLRSKLDHSKAAQGSHLVLRNYYKELLRLRRTVPALTLLSKNHLEAKALEQERVLLLKRWTEGPWPPGQGAECYAAFAFHDEPVTVELPIPEGRWVKLLDSAEERWLGPGSDIPHMAGCEEFSSIRLNSKSCVLLARESEV